MCTELLPSGVNPIAVNKYIISYHIIAHKAQIYKIRTESVPERMSGIDLISVF